MKKKTVIIVSLALVVAILAIAVIATFPSYLLEEPQKPTGSAIHSGIIDPSKPTSTTDKEDTAEVPEEQGVDIGVVGGNDESGVEAVLPGIDEEELPVSSTPSNNANKDDDKTDNKIENETGLQTVATAKNATLLAEQNSFDKDVKVKLKKLNTFNEDYYLARYYTKAFANRFTAYKYSATQGGKDYQAKGIVKLVINVPEKYDINNISVCYLFSKNVQILNSSINKQDRTVTVTATSTGVYILVENKPADEIEYPDDKEDNASSNTSSDASADNSSTESSDKDNSSSDSSDNTSSDTTSSDPNKESMDGWSPWQ